jgi:hypothetical protein
MRRAEGVFIVSECAGAGQQVDCSLRCNRNPKAMLEKLSRMATRADDPESDTVGAVVGEVVGEVFVGSSWRSAIGVESSTCHERKFRWP